MSETKTQESNTTKIIFKEEVDHFLNTKKKNSSIIANAVFMCILAALPLIFASIMEVPDYIGCAFTSLLLLMVGTGANMIIRVSIVKNSYDILLQEGEFSKEEKLIKRKKDAFSSVYWCLVTATYLGWSFLTRQWDTTWMIWPVAGVLFTAITGIFKMIFIRDRKEDEK